jgi:NAD(P)-dependent dehydrogenase (short-subunit alcohol dehydrogenase family)
VVVGCRPYRNQRIMSIGKTDVFHGESEEWNCGIAMNTDTREVKTVKTFLSIGSGPGMGYATAARFAREGFQIVLSARNPTNTQELADRLKAKGCRVEVRTVNSGDRESVAALVAEVEKQFGSVDVLHYNAASLRKAKLAQQPRATFVQDLAVNIGGALVATQAVTERMSERRSGTILLTGGGLSLAPNSDFISLSIGKAGIRALALGTFDSLKQKGIHIATVTVLAAVAPDSEQAEAVAEQFWQLHCQPVDKWTAEVKYTG